MYGRINRYIHNGEGAYLLYLILNEVKQTKRLSIDEVFIDQMDGEFRLPVVTKFRAPLTVVLCCCVCKCVEIIKGGGFFFYKGKKWPVTLTNVLVVGRTGSVRGF